MAATVPDRRLIAQHADIDAGRAVRAATWRDVALTANWTLGRGAMLVPAHAVGLTLMPGNEYEFRYRVRPRPQAIERVWSIHSRVAGTGPAYLKVEVPSGSAPVELSPAPRRGVVYAFRASLVTETVAAPSSTEQTLTLAITPQLGSVIIDSISCWEVPRAELTTNSTDDGTDIAQINPGQPMRGSTVAQLAQVYADPTQIGRRASLWQWAVPVAVNGVTTTSYAKTITTSAPFSDDVFSLPIPMLARKIGRNDITSQVRAKVLAWVSSGTGSVRLVSSKNGASGDVNISTTTPAWSSAITLDVDCEDLDSDDGRQTAATPTWDEVDLEARVTTAGPTLYIAAVSVWEA